MSTTTHLPPKVDTSAFYREWKGHPIENLANVRDIIHAIRPKTPIVYLAGDSSLDNKAWVTPSDPPPVPVPEIYQQLLQSTRGEKMKPDISYWLNHLLGDQATCINAAVEESLLRERDDDLLSHDKFIQDSITSNDILIVSVGANDIALRPNTQTMLHMADLAWTTKRSNIENGSASSLKYFRKFFKEKTQAYIERMVSKHKPRAVIVCMIYYPLEASAGQTSWADLQLRALGYGQNPGQLQAAIKQMYLSGTLEIKVAGTQVMGCPLFEILDPRNADDFTARVEPSVQGGRKMAEAFEKMIREIVESV
ncbi:hypothetical protein M011DRAFT_456074 [Sporormia fimetaria CBS 119925]|uniref:SGNH hydrolase-type esterase domain-containing protein n=1 Tax=Sporormia fimetaria CBS 119925 TaxID=1340428 RepID=A0A6A6VLN9_9PLEO|nr:hypothetical protein M011DRAFT_456074 [Sporormia fimetaria CBS 119925]